MDVSGFFKTLFPVVNFFLLLIFFFRNKISTSVKFVIFLLFSYFNFSGNFEFVFREIYQVVIIGFVVYCFLFEFNIDLKFPRYVMFLFFLAILLSYCYNDCFFNLNSNIALLNYIFVSLTVYGIISIAIKDKNALFYINNYLKELLFVNSLVVIGLFFYHGVGYRVTYTYSNSNYLACFLGFSMIYSNYVKPNSTKDHLTIFLTLFAVFCTGSRSVLLICVPFIVMLYFKKNIIAFMLLAVIMVLIATYFFDTLIEMARLKDMDDDVSILQRYEIRDVVFNIFKERPLLGIGYGRFIDSYKSYLSVNVDYIDNLDEIVTHNDYYRVLSELGLLGFLIFIFILIKSFIYIIRQKFNYFVFFSFSMAVSYSYTHNNLNSYLFWLMIFVPYIIIKRDEFS
ncbi:O-antigen ligase family protein [Flavobacterium columnare]|uniref:O-antigen ligase family protein n=1 Tax=Flavobacterium columnare TaxID=996 RepID=A0AA94F0L3_9FLAO|nr:O-antigen ligase family protein [Flavobacterium columnare]MCH4829057.1 O-antigen ligase family protein [Flavobacterium columnare]MCH4833833.1 O-antigen ligase family protein [Flavobacterium columnare]